MIKLVTNAITLYNDKVLLVKKDDLYYLPEAEVDKDHTIKDLLIDHMLDNCKLRLTPVGMLGVYDEVNRNPKTREIAFVYICKFENEPKDFENKSIEAHNILDIVQEKIKLGKDHKKMIDSYYLITNYSKNTLREGINKK